MQLEADRTSDVRQYLLRRGFLSDDERLIATEKAGEGNMNVTILATTNRRKLIVKQSRAWVAKFPTIPAPIERIATEHRYLVVCGEDPTLARHHPRVLGFDRENHTLLLEYLADARDMTYVYQPGRALTTTHLRSLLGYLSALHRLNVSDFPDNTALRKLNHAHIFDLPFRADNGFPLEDFAPGLTEIARPLREDAGLRRKVRQLGERYLANGRQLIHGDFYPGSIMRKGDRVFVIDGEFAHRGLPEFDLGVLMAHLLLAKAERELLEEIDRSYDKPPTFNARLAREFCYVEVIRRLIGIAQLPIDLTIGERQTLLEQASLGLK